MNKVKIINDFLDYQIENYPLNKAITSKRNGEWQSMSSQEFKAQIDQLSRALLQLGVKKGDKIAMITSNNRTEWSVTDLALLQIGAINVPIYPTISKEDYEYIINHSESIYCFASCTMVVEKLNGIKGNTCLKDVFTFDNIAGENNWYDLLETGKDLDNQNQVNDLRSEINPKDLATIIYTSGTTGKPKGVMLSHDNLVSNVTDSAPRVPIERGIAKALSFLPVCHVFERMILYLYQFYGIEIYFAESMETIGDNLKEIQPQIMTAVPRLYEKLYDKIVGKGAELTGLKKKLFFWAVELGLKYEPYGKNGSLYEFKLGIARKLIFKKWQEALGGKLEVLVSGSAALQPRLIRTFMAAGMPILEGYGLTETSPVISVNTPANEGIRIGAVGRIIDRVEVKIAEDGEILVKGPNVMMGYYKDEQLTNEVMTNGYFHTGDIGEVSADGFLKITDRKKEMFKTSGGKYVAPALLENELKESRFIEQVMVVGEGEKMPAAFIQPNFEFILEWAKRKDINCSNELSEICSNKAVNQRILKEIEICNENFGKWEQIKQFRLTPEVWSIDTGLLTPTLKMKRKVIKKHFQSIYDDIYRK